MRIIIVSEAPRFIFEDAILHGCEYRNEKIDTNGVAQSDPLRTDCIQTENLVFFILFIFETNLIRCLTY